LYLEEAQMGSRLVQLRGGLICQLLVVTALAQTPLFPADPKLVQLHRPPEQTPIEKEVRHSNVASAPQKSAAATVALTAGLACDAALCKGMTAEQLYDVLQYEFPRLPFIHNIPMNSEEDHGDDTDLWTTLHNGYLQNVIQRFVLSTEESRSNMIDEGRVMEIELNYPAFKNPNFPTLREANDRMIYAANNWEKKDCGNFQYGALTLALNPLYDDKFFVAPADTGAHPQTSGVELGTLRDFDHVVAQHLQLYRYNMSEMFDSWYEQKPAPSCTGANYCYFEVEWSGSAWLPESLLYIIAKAGNLDEQHTGLFGTQQGSALQTWMQKSRRPLVWADGDNSGMLLDPVVDWLGYNGKKYIVDADRTFWTNAWKANTSFPTLYSSAASHLKMEYRSYFTKDICENDEKYAGKMVMGVLTTDKLCVFWQWGAKGLSNKLGSKWECTNDGTCAPSDDPVRAKWSTYDDCFKECGQGKWKCVSATDDPKRKHCTPDATGTISPATSCEQSDCASACEEQCVSSG
jgi:hypothetical protein